MFQLDTYDEDFHDRYVARILPSFKKRIKKNITYTKKWKDEEGHEQSRLMTLSDEAKNIIMPGFRGDSPNTDNVEYLMKKNPSEILNRHRDIWRELDELPEAIRPDEKLIELLFNYDGIFSRNKENSYWLARQIGRNSCTYCNRIYSFTIIAIKKGEDGLTDEPDYITRPQFDHWFPKSKYPLLSLSLYNLIPSCPICNSTIKGERAMNLEEYIHPYVKDSGAQDFKFIATLNASPTPEWTLEIERIPGSKIDKTIKFLKLEAIYSHHAGLEVKDIMNFEEAYKKGYINNIVENIFNDNLKGLTKKEVYRILFGVEYDNNSFLDRPLSKLKRDLFEQIGLKSL